MAEENYLFRTNPDVFLSYVFNKADPMASEAFRHVENVIMYQFLSFGARPQSQMVGGLLEIYRKYILPANPEQRLSFYRDILYFPEHYDSISAEVLLPIMISEPTDGLAATAAIDLASLGSLSNNDPMTRVKQIIELLESGLVEDPGAVFGALLNLGDPRVCKLLIPIRDGFKSIDLSSMAKSSTGFIHGPTVRFLIDWLEGLEGDRLDGAFGNVASALALLARDRRSDQVTDGLRPFPAKNVTADAWKRSYNAIPFEEFAKSIVTDLYALERSEPPPRVMPNVLRAWGIEPLTPKSEEAEVQPRRDRADTSAAVTSWPAPLPDGYLVDVRCEWWDGTGQIYLMWGILNPNGPTLYTLGSREFSGKHRMFFRWLHMLGGETTFDNCQRDQISYQDIYDAAKRINDHLISADRPGIFTTVPNFLIASGDDQTLIRIGQDIVREMLSPTTDWGRYFAYANQFRSDFFGMAGAQIRETYDQQLAEARSRGEEPSEFLKWTEARYGHLPDFRDAKVPMIRSSSLTPEIFAKWWEILSAAGYNVKALGALRFMWEGAASVLSDDMRKNAIPWNPIITFLESYKFYLKDGEHQPASEETQNIDPAIAELIKKAENGEPDAQAELAARLERGDRIEANPRAAAYWLEKAADSGNSWAQTTLAIKLRQTGDPEKERGSIIWLDRAIEQDDARAMYTRGLHRLAGIGTTQDTISAYLDFIAASFAGDPDAKKFLKEQPHRPSDEEWFEIFSKVKWPVISIIFGEPAPGHLTPLQHLKESDDGSDDAAWLVYEKKSAELMIISENGKESPISVALDEPVQVKEISVCRSHVDGHTCASININLKNIVSMQNSMPILYKPNLEALKSLFEVLALTNARQSMRLNYTRF